MAVLRVYDTKQLKWVIIPAIKGSGSEGTIDYSDLINKPKINDVILSGNVSLDTLGITDLIDTKINTAIGNALKGSY